jgi:hypothetical protein
MMNRLLLGFLTIFHIKHRRHKLHISGSFLPVPTEIFCIQDSANKKILASISPMTRYGDLGNAESHLSRRPLHPLSNRRRPPHRRH